MGNGYTEYDFRALVKSCMLEAIKYKWNEVPEEERVDWDCDTALEAVQYDGTINEVADGCVPIYNTDIAETWVALGMPEAEDYGADLDYCGLDNCDIIYQMRVGILLWAEAYAYGFFEDFYNEVVAVDLTKK